jgi:AcrR family transcriptional regulator
VHLLGASRQNSDQTVIVLCAISGPVSSRSSVPSPPRVAEPAKVPLKRSPTERPGPPGGKRDVNRKQRTQAIAEASLALFLEHGVEGVTIDDIARAASIAKGSFYRYFADKTELVAALFDPMSRLVRDAMKRCEHELETADDRGSLVAAYQGLAQRLIAVALGHVDVARLYLQESRAPGQPARAPIRALALDLENGAIRLTEVAVEKGLLRIPDPRISAIAVVGAIEQLALAFVGGRLDAPAPEVAMQLIDLVLEGLRNRE